VPRDRHFRNGDTALRHGVAISIMAIPRHGIAHFRNGDTVATKKPLLLGIVISKHGDMPPCMAMKELAM
jgi:hypothetical protein